MFTGKHVKFFEISLEAVIGGNKYVNIADFNLKKWKMTQNLLETLNVLTFQLSNVRELETIKDAFAPQASNAIN